MKTTRAGRFELFALGVAEAAALLLLAGWPGKLSTLLWAVCLPLTAWLYARWRSREHVCAIVGTACGLAAYPVSHGLFSLLVLPFPLQLLGALGVVAEALHGSPAYLVVRFADLEPQGDTSLAVLLLDYLLNGLVWAAIYGRIGHHLDQGRRPR